MAFCIASERERASDIMMQFICYKFFSMTNFSREYTSFFYHKNPSRNTLQRNKAQQEIDD